MDDPDLASFVDALRSDLLPQLQLELALPDSDSEWLSEWLSDTGSMFRLLKYHDFSPTFALQEIRSLARWRLHVLRPVLRPVLLLSVPTLFHCLPPPITDSSGRPIVFFKLAALQSLSFSAKDVLLQEAERLRLHLRYIHDLSTGSVSLQFIVLVDLDGISIQFRNPDLCSWILTDIIPRYPGMFAAVFLLNYSWVHTGAWSVAKRVLPSSIIARVSFPSKAQLLDHCSAAALPAEYGGSLPTLDQIDDALRSSYQTRHLPPPPRVPVPVPVPIASPSSPTSTLQRAPSTIVLSPYSPRNPFYGYPAVASSASPHTIRSVRRGLRELVRTLVVLWWRRWGRCVWRCARACAAVCLAVILVRIRLARMGLNIWARARELVFLLSTRARSR